MQVVHALIPRALEGSLKQLFRQFPVVVVTGARQVGKSTLMERVFPTTPCILFDPIIDISGAKSDPDLFLDSYKTPLVLDEIQYVPQLVPALKRRLDQNRRPSQYLITGSQQWQVMRLLTESLAGRAIILNLHPFSCAEIQHTGGWLQAWLEGNTPLKRKRGKRTLVEQLWRGFLPEAQFIKDATIPHFYHSYTSTYVDRDARQMADVSDWQLFARFYRLCAALTAQEINHSELGRDLGITPQTAMRWLDILKATFQWHDIPAFSRNAVKRVSGKAKGYFFDTGLVCSALAISAPSAVSSHPQWGAIFETLCVNEVLKQCSIMSPSPIPYHWRVHGGSEVDLILEWNGCYYPIEIKSKSHPDRHDARGIAIFRKTYATLKVGKGLIVAPCEDCYPITPEVDLLPWDAAAAIN